VYGMSCSGSRRRPNLAAQRLNLSPEEAKAKAQVIHDAFYRQASDTIGPVSETVFEYMRANDPQTLRRAVNDHVQSGNLAGYRQGYTKFVENLDTLYPDFLMSQDSVQALNGRREADGQLSIEVRPGVRTSWRNAVKTGLIPMPKFNHNPFKC
jgi:hypothetical protein